MEPVVVLVREVQDVRGVQDLPDARTAFAVVEPHSDEQWYEVQHGIGVHAVEHVVHQPARQFRVVRPQALRSLHTGTHRCLKDVRDRRPELEAAVKLAGEIHSPRVAVAHERTGRHGSERAMSREP
ncbi:hypothetical protein ACH40E_20145 [Streptomyces acidicola]|uniref:hypothetical protein n=1 Tax=Streptomyces acidicola TaxID=2596892 RepID=UPI00378F19AF